MTHDRARTSKLYLAGMFSALFLLILSFLLFNQPYPALAQPSAWPTITLTRIAPTHTFAVPVYLNHAGDSSGRMFVVEQNGRIQIIKNGAVLATPFLDITGRVQFNGEEGLLNVVFPPQYASKGYFYVYYTRKDGNNQVSRFHITSNPDVADPTTEEQILFLAHPGFTNHNGGQMAFGPDGYLYIGTGDGGGAGDPNGNGQNFDVLLGKLLRIDVEPHVAKPPSGANLLYLPILSRDMQMPVVSQPYHIPPTNPFVGLPNHRPEIWAFGLRNPWRFSFDRQTGDVYIGDVGQDRIEEVDFQPAASHGGENYGWNILEGNLCFNPSSGCVPPPNYSAPVATYLHGTNDSIGCSITGGYIYRGAVSPALQGIYLYADFCSGRIWGLQKVNSTWQTQELLKTSYAISSFGQDQSGELYVLDYSGGIYHITSP